MEKINFENVRTPSRRRRLQLGIDRVLPSGRIIDAEAKCSAVDEADDQALCKGIYLQDAAQGNGAAIAT